MFIKSYPSLYSDSLYKNVQDLLHKPKAHCDIDMPYSLFLEPYLLTDKALDRRAWSTNKLLCVTERAAAPSHNASNHL